jgi:hypothetical protein
MLDLTQLARQMQGLSQHLTLEAAASRQRLELAQQHLKNAYDCQDDLVQRQEKWRDRIIFSNATPVEPLDACIDIQLRQRYIALLLPTVPKLPRITTKLLTAIFSTSVESFCTTDKIFIHF